MTKTPIEVWPPRHFSGRPGYSARHFAALAGEPSDPLTVATRIATLHAADAIGVQAKKKVAAGESWSAVYCDWLPGALTQSALEVYEKLKASFEAVIEVLETEAHKSKAMKQLSRQARRALAESRRTS